MHKAVNTQTSSIRLRSSAASTTHSPLSASRCTARREYPVPEDSAASPHPPTRVKAVPGPSLSEKARIICLRVSTQNAPYISGQNGTSTAANTTKAGFVAEYHLRETLHRCSDWFSHSRVLRVSQYWRPKCSEYSSTSSTNM